MIWSNKIKITPDMMRAIKPTSKLSLKLSCLAISNGDVEKADKMYEYFAKDMELPDVDPVPPTTFQQVKDTAGTIFGWIKDNKDDVTQALSYVQALRSGQPLVTTPAAPLDLPPLPTE